MSAVYADEAAEIALHGTDLISGDTAEGTFRLAGGSVAVVRTDTGITHPVRGHEQ